MRSAVSRARAVRGKYLQRLASREDCRHGPHTESEFFFGRFFSRASDGRLPATSRASFLPHRRTFPDRDRRPTPSPSPRLAPRRIFGSRWRTSCAESRPWRTFRSSHLPPHEGGGLGRRRGRLDLGIRRVRRRLQRNAGDLAVAVREAAREPQRGGRRPPSRCPRNRSRCPASRTRRRSPRRCWRGYRRTPGPRASRALEAIYQQASGGCAGRRAGDGGGAKPQ